MTRRSQTLVNAVLITLFVLLIPFPALSQEQTEPVPPREENSFERQNQQKAAEAPDGNTSVDGQQGVLIVPGGDETAPDDFETNEGPSTKEESSTKKASSKTENETYIIKRGDTLWDISHALLKDPFLWPFIWKANPYISNADLIYPGNKLVIPSMVPIEQALENQEELAQSTGTKEGDNKLGKTGTTEEGGQKKKVILPEEKPVPLVDIYSMLNAGFISQDESKDLIVGSKEGKTIAGYDDIVYVTLRSKKDAAIGDKFVIYAPLNHVKHPITGKNFGRLIKVLGILELAEQGAPGTYAARITLSFDSIEMGSMLTPYQKPTLIYKSAAPAKTKEISGYIVEVTDTRTINGQIDIVYLDKGSADGVEQGDHFMVYAEPERKIYPKPLLGEAQVFLVKEHTSTAVLRKTADTVERGDHVVYKR